MGKILSVVGARPNFVKLAALHPVISKYFEHVIVHTGQHYDYELSATFFEELSIPEPDYYLGIGSGTHGYQVGEGVKLCERVLLREEPDFVIVYGDTNSTLAGAIASVKAGFKLAHVEAGLRCFDMSMPEEVNRVIVDRISTLLFAPTKGAVGNLKREGIIDGVRLVGDVHKDLLLRFKDSVRPPSSILEGVRPKDYVLVTIHRAENTEMGRNLSNLTEALLRISDFTEVVFPIHPRTERALSKLGMLGRLKEKVRMIKPLNYLSFIALLKYSSKVITDSGGVQREAYMLGVPCITVRERTEWRELAEAGWNILVGTDPDRIVTAVREFRPPLARPNLLGDGNASLKIVNVLKEEIR